jgi:hypothetical protein
MAEIKETVEEEKRVKRLPVPFDDKSMKILIGLQGDYQSKYKRKIDRADLAGIIMAKALKNAGI